MLLEAGIADAYGAGFEFASEDIIKNENRLVAYRKHPRYDSICATYTDDTQMAIAISELILYEKEWTDVDIANAFVAVFKRDPRRGYSSRFYAILEIVKNGKELIEVITPTSTRNGAAMRSYPIGVHPEEAEVIKKAAQQAKITHNTKEGILSAQIIALSTHYFIYNKGPKKELVAYLEKQLATSFSFQRESTVQMQAIATVNTVIALVLGHNSMSNCLKEAVSLGGDTDTVASLAIAILSVCKDTEKDLPNWMNAALEKGVYGSSYLIKLDSELTEWT